MKLGLKYVVYEGVQHGRVNEQPSSGSAQKKTNRVAGMQMTVEEAKKILSVKDLDPSEIQNRYDYLFKINDTTNGGSFYLQSKVYRAKECLDTMTKRQQSS